MIGRVAALVVTGALLALVPATPAAACSSPPASPGAVFRGIVTGVDDSNRVATVRTDDGATVTVIGIDRPDDRTYTVGERYEFHPVDGASPYHDNGCTATRRLGAARPSHGGGGPVLLFGVVLAIGVFLLIRRWARGYRKKLEDS